jgi:RES domain-containing protein
VPPITVWRIATDTPDYQANDLEGRGAELTGGRWNRRGTPMLYASTSRALACLETVVHLGAGSLPLNRYLVEIIVPSAAWESRTIFDPDANVGWDAEPAGMVSLDWGTAWANGMSTLLAEVPSVVVPEEPNILINPRHPAAASLRARKVRRWTYDVRLRSEGIRS